MADFVAVIRRAVDGLATNTPETRAKVYVKARDAVQRQLENMKPRPSEDMLRRQMDKLQAAIDEVEAEHREALAPVDEPYLATTGAADFDHGANPEHSGAGGYHSPSDLMAPAAVYQDRGQSLQDEPESQPPAAAEAPDEVVHETGQQAFANQDEPEELRYEPEAQPGSPDPYAYADAAAAVHPGHHESYEAESGPAQEWTEEASVSPAIEQRYADEHRPASEPPPFLSSDREPEASQPAPAAQLEDDFPYPVAEQQTPAAHAPDAPPVEPHWHAEPHSAGQEPHAQDWDAVEPAQHGNGDVAAAWDHVPELVPAGPVEAIERGPSAEGLDAHFEDETRVAADAVRMPPVSELPDLDPPAAARRAADDPFSDHFDPQPKAAPQTSGTERDPWSDLEDLIGYNGNEAAPPAASSSAVADDDIDDFMPPPAKPYRVTPARKRNYTGLVLSLIGLLLLGGGAYAIWLNRDSLNEMVGGLLQSNQGSEQATQEAPQAQPAASAAPSADQGSTQAAAPAPQQTPPAAPAANAAKPPAADGAASSSKFTQRLMPDGNEVDEGPGGTGSLAQNAEGQSVAQLNAPPANPAPQAGSQPAAPAAGATAQGAQAPAPAATPADAPALAGEKMFLYEERIGQTAPTAVDGTVSWSLQREPGANGAATEPVVQGRITIPGRGLTALLTFKRNNDPSLPASHLIEIVFAVPPDFEGGAIESVQRIAMKQTEQDRGTALVAVPAKITDDFHMIALNDFPDARNTNLELLRTRNWIDIPVAYRNGRRALLTLQKGPEGEKAFTDAIREWGQLGTAPTGQ